MAKISATLSCLLAFLLVAVNHGAVSGQQSKIVGNSGVSAQMMFLQSNGQVAMIDKVENNPIQRPDIKAPASAVFYNYNTNGVRASNIETNAFCAGGAPLGDGRWIVVGGNKAVRAGGLTAEKNRTPYFNTDGGKSLRLLSPCSGNSCQWKESSNDLQRERWYATLEPLEDGSVMILGGMKSGGYVPSQSTNEPTIEYYPRKTGPIELSILRDTVPLSLYPITYLLSDNRLFIQAYRRAVLYDRVANTEKRLPNIHGPPRVYPASGGSAMLPLTPANNYTETILFCGGQTLGSKAAWGWEGGPNVMVTQKPASTSCTQIKPLVDPKWEDVDDLPEGRTMGQFINLPDGTLWFANGGTTGTAGYTTDPNSAGRPVGNSFADNPSLTPRIYDPAKPKGQRWSEAGRTKVPRVYHSSARLLPDSSILIAGSNPAPDVSYDQKFKTEYRVERWYPSYYNQKRPSNSGIPGSLGYGGSGFSLKMGSADEASKTKVVVIRTGFSTHGLQMGQRMLELRSSANGNTVNVAAMPPNAALFAPGPALAFVVVNGVPSQGKFIMVGSGQIGRQPVGTETSLGGSSRAIVSKVQMTSQRISGQQSSENDTASTQVPTSFGTQSTVADQLASVLGGGDGNSGAPLPLSDDGHKNTSSQMEVDNIMKGLADGTIKDKLHG